MYEGKVTIDLHNHKTGLRDRIEGKNAITSGFQSLFNTMVKILPDYPDKFRPITTTLLGGILAMDTTLDGDDTIIPSGTSVIANGYYDGYNTSSIYTGTYNSLESSFNESDVSITHVYDFATTQGNGTIKSVAITPYLSGKYPFYLQPMSGEGTFIGAWFGSSANHIFLYQDTTNKDLYYLNYTDRYVYKVKLYDFTSIRIDDATKNDTTRLIPEGIKTDKQLTIPTNRFYYDGKDGYVYSISASGQTMTVNRVKVDDFSFTETLSYKTITFPGSIMTGRNAIAIDVENEKAYALSNTGAILYVYDMDGNTTQQINLSDFGVSNNSSSSICLMENGDIYLKLLSSGTAYKGIRVSGSVAQCDTNITTTSNSNYGQQWGTVLISGNSVYPNINRALPISNILMTNYNLPTTINKTNSQSMKITYTIRQV